MCVASKLSRGTGRILPQDMIKIGSPGASQVVPFSNSRTRRCSKHSNVKRSFSTITWLVWLQGNNLPRIYSGQHSPFLFLVFPVPRLYFWCHLSNKQFYLLEGRTTITTEYSQPTSNKYWQCKTMQCLNIEEIGNQCLAFRHNKIYGYKRVQFSEKQHNDCSSSADWCFK